MIKVKSVYAKPLEEDGKRFLVDLFWPEGIHTHAADVDEWFTELGPTYDLQRFHFDNSNWDNYKSMYEKVIMNTPEKKKLLQDIAKQSKDTTVTLLYGSKDARHNHAVILKELIENNFK